MSIAFFIILIALLLVFCVWTYRNPARAVAVVAFLLPLEYISSFEWAGVTVRLSQIAALCVGIVWLARGILQKELRLVWHVSFFPLALFFVGGIFSFMNAPDIFRSTQVYAFLVFTIGFGMLVPSIVKTKEALLSVVGVLLLSCLAVSLFGLYQYMGDMAGLGREWTGLRPHYQKEVLGFPRVQGTALEPLYFANMLFLPLFLLFALFVSGERFLLLPRWVLWLTFVIGVVVFLLTFARGAYAGAVVGLVSLLIIFWKDIFAKKIFFPFVGTIIVLFFIVGVAMVPRLSAVTTHIKTSFSGAAFTERMQTWGIAVDVWKQHPIVGAGAGSFGPLAYHYPRVWKVEGYKIVNNIYLEVLAEFGTLGFVSFCAFLFLLGRGQWRALQKVGEGRWIVAGLFAAFVATLMQYATFSILYILPIWFLFGLMVASQHIINNTSDTV